MSGKTLLQKIEEKSAVIGVVGLGYVGLPLAVEKAKAGYKVIGFDILPHRVDMVNKGINYIGDVVDEELKNIVSKGQLKATTDYSLISEVDAVAICVPTPLDKYQQPNVSYVESSAKSIAKYLHRKRFLSRLFSGTRRSGQQSVQHQKHPQSGGRRNPGMHKGGGGPLPFRAGRRSARRFQPKSG
jgi:UDP-N-acetyl-D-mannosaminuronate dehydrogenase